ncbi:CLUMA_CG020012, isoform A [Clunio marinus]|uniref:CDGSH iron-sulfur domain-containing protein 2 homologue n=1 Tax=Clunio marinus TaxID=568069 RepID=A0A1J1J3N7_9DIPT|nr:CLUMA_CG020012, isoform A [Clunio marinus]
MELISTLVKKTIPNYLSGLPIPDTFGGWFKLGFKDWVSLVPPTALTAGLVYVSYLALCPASPCRSGARSNKRVNQKVRLNEAKVVDMIDIEDISEKAAFCRCWKSKNWPYCDGTHGEHNKECNDNVGPVVVSRKQK